MKEPLRTLVLQGVKQSGSYDPDKALLSVEESMTGVEIETATMFLDWIRQNKLTFGDGNIDTLFSQFRQWRMAI